jgi:hypothetical protein
MSWDDASREELIAAIKALGKKCTELEEARDRNAELCDNKDEEIGWLRVALERIVEVEKCPDDYGNHPTGHAIASETLRRVK